MLPVVLFGFGGGVFIACWFFSANILLFFASNPLLFSSTVVFWFIMLFIAVWAVLAHGNIKEQIDKNEVKFKRKEKYLDTTALDAHRSLRNVTEKNKSLEQQVLLFNRGNFIQKIETAQLANKKLNNEKKRMSRDLKNCRIRIKRYEARINSHSA